MLAVLLFWGCQNERAQVRIDILGRTKVAAINVDSGICTAPEKVVASDSAFANCGLPLGERTIQVVCANQNLKKARLIWVVPRGDSHYIQFRNPCEMSDEQIDTINAATKKQAMIWNPVSQ
jgi:hypothetical protein